MAKMAPRVSVEYLVLLVAMALLDRRESPVRRETQDFLVPQDLRDQKVYIYIYNSSLK